MVFSANFNDISVKSRRQFYWRRKPEGRGKPPISRKSLANFIP